MTGGMKDSRAGVVGNRKGLVNSKELRLEINWIEGDKKGEERY